MMNPWEPDPNAPPAGPDISQLPGQVGAYLSNPHVNSALLSAGLTLMQPPSFGDNAMSQIARAVGAGGEALRSQDAQDLAQRKQQVSENEAESKADLRGAQAETSAARAQAAQTAADAATTRAQAAGESASSRSQAEAAKAQQSADRLIYQRQNDEANRRLRTLGLTIKMSQAYNAMKSKAEQQNANNRLLGQPETPIPSFDEFVTNNPQLKALYEGAVPEASSSDVPLSTPYAATAGGPAPRTTAPSTTAPTTAPAIPAPEDRRDGLQIWSPKLGRNVTWNAKTKTWE